MKRNFGSDDELPKMGYCNPPKHSQFKKGVSGNPAGRKKGSCRQSAIEKVIRKKFAVVEGGKSRRLPCDEALYKQMANAALAGDRHARRDFLRLIEKSPAPKGSVEDSSASNPARVVFIKDSTELLLALGICIEVDGICMLCSWAIDAARERQAWAALSEEDEKLLEEFGEPGFKRAA